MARETRSTASKLYFPPNPTPKARTVPEYQMQPPGTPRKPKLSRAMLPAENNGPRGAFTLEMALTGQDRAAANLEGVAPGASPSPTSTAMLNRRRRSGCSVPARKLSGGRKGSPEMLSSHLVEHKKKVDAENVIASDLKNKGKALMRRVDGQSTNAIQSRKRTRDELESEPAPAAKARKTEPVVEQNTKKKEPVKQSQIPTKMPEKKHHTRQQGTRYTHTPKVVIKNHPKAQDKQTAKKQKSVQDPAKKAARGNLVKKAVKKQPVRQAKLKNLRAH